MARREWKSVLAATAAPAGCALLHLQSRKWLGGSAAAAPRYLPPWHRLPHQVPLLWLQRLLLRLLLPSLPREVRLLSLAAGRVLPRGPASALQRRPSKVELVPKDAAWWGLWHTGQRSAKRKGELLAVESDLEGMLQQHSVTQTIKTPVLFLSATVHPNMTCQLRTWEGLPRRHLSMGSQQPADHPLSCILSLAHGEGCGGGGGGAGRGPWPSTSLCPRDAPWMGSRG